MGEFFNVFVVVFLGLRMKVVCIDSWILNLNNFFYGVWKWGMMVVMESLWLLSLINNYYVMWIVIYFSLVKELFDDVLVEFDW